MTITSNRRKENLQYLIIWVVAIVVYLLDDLDHRSASPDGIVVADVIMAMCRTLAPFVILFIINNFYLIPRYFLKGAYRKYYFWVSCSLILIGIYLYYSFTAYHPPHYIQGIVPLHHPAPRHLIPMPYIHQMIFAIMVIVGNILIALMNQRENYEVERQKLIAANIHDRLQHLKAQINPHFYMNMLNNIHGLIELDPVKAQDMVYDMSKLMRYMLYDSQRERISLDSEVQFLNDYLRIMRQRFPEEKVSITASMPDEEQCGNIEIPPLLFLVFIENAFKHGVSYRSMSYVAINIYTSDNKLTFSCVNSVAETPSTNRDSGVGLQNIRHRLNLIYGSQADLNIQQDATSYMVTLTIPTHETTDTNN